MKAVIQRTTTAEVRVNGKRTGKIDLGLVVLLGVNKGDTNKDAEILADKITNLRIFEDSNGKMNLSLADVSGSILIISQFTLSSNCKKGRRPSFNDAAPPDEAEKLYNYTINCIAEKKIPVETGVFGAMMDVELINNGPVTFILDSDVLLNKVV